MIALLLLTFSIAAQAATPLPPCKENVHCKNGGTAGCSALTAAPFPSNTNHEIFTWSSGTCAKEKAFVSCKQSSSTGGINGPLLESRDVTTYLCCDGNGAAFETSDAVFAAKRCDHASDE